MKTRKEIKLQAKSGLRLKYGGAVFSSLFYSIAVWLVSALILTNTYLELGSTGSKLYYHILIGDGSTYSYISLALALLVALFFVTPLSYGVKAFFLRLYNRKDVDDLNIGVTLHTGFYGFGRKLAGMVKMFLYIFFWSILFTIPGVIKGFAYALTPYILNDNPTMPAGKAITISRQLMKGHKWQLFVMRLSFIGWHIVAACTLGILEILFIEPYYEAAMAGFYDEVLEEGKRNGIVPPEMFADTEQEVSTPVIAES